MCHVGLPAQVRPIMLLSSDGSKLSLITEWCHSPVSLPLTCTVHNQAPMEPRESAKRRKDAILGLFNLRFSMIKLLAVFMPLLEP
ncbi:hypothetical protein KFK09_018542 [Dendrobium nobile]|uniref:Uncharacterized protein n=1 Tax=Dendrobium nobile TaxID=94219 RepID=A0A8T3AW22_DENNO|nr:hypothetical protein KFK09_018542 [Dendrobium nobile]